MSEDRSDRELRAGLDREAPGPVPPSLARRVADIPIAAAKPGRAGDRTAWLMLAGVATLAVVLVGGLVAGGWSIANQAATATAGPTHSTEPSPSPASPVASPTAGTPSPSEDASPFPYPILAVPTSGRIAVTLPAGSDLDVWHYAADADWMLMNVTFQGSDIPARAFYAADLGTGTITRLGTGYVDQLSLDGSRAAWVDATCTDHPGTPGDSSCTSWQVVLADLATGARRVVAHGIDPDMVNTPTVEIGSVPLVPAVALHDGVVAYTTGSLAKGVQLTLLTLASGATRTIAVGGMIEDLRWMGGDLAGIEDGSLHLDAAAAGFAHPYYASSRLMILASGSTTARQIATLPYSIAADQGRVAWNSDSVNGPGNEVWTAAAPDWTPARLATDVAAASVSASGGWLGWSAGSDAPYLVLRPQDSAPHGVVGGLAVAGGWLILGTRLDDYGLPTQLQLVRLADVP